MDKWLNKSFFGIDQSIFRFVFEMIDRCPWLAKLARFISYFGDHGYFFIGMTILFLVFRKTRKMGLLLAIGLLVGELINNIIMKNLVSRPRPYDEVEEFYIMWKTFSNIKMNSFSFPSGHTCMAMMFGGGLFIMMNKKYSWLFLLIGPIMAWSRIALFVHYPSDVLFGMLFGVISITCAYFLLKLLLKWNFMYNLTTGDKLF